MPKLIYIAGPLTIGDTAYNIRNAIDAAERLAEFGYTPVIPHLSYFWHMVYYHTHEFWLEIDKAIIHRCDAVLRIPGESR